MSVVQAELFGTDLIEEVAQESKGPRWVVEVNEAQLFTYSGTSSEAAEWWAVHAGRPGIERRTTYLIIGPPGALLYLSCEDKEEAQWLAGYMVGKGCSPKAVRAVRIGQPITCGPCGEKRPFWHRSKRCGVMCYRCFTGWVGAGCPIRYEPVVAVTS